MALETLDGTPTVYEPPRWYVVRHRFLRNLAKCLIIAAILIALFYLEEDWRGAQALASAKAAWEARGESLDYAKFIPPTVPDEQNLAALPLFEVGDEKNQREVHIGLLNLRKALHEDIDASFVQDKVEIPPTGNWQHGELTDMKRFQDMIAKDYALVFPGQSAPADPAAQFAALYPVVADLRAAAVTRTAFRLNCDYTSALPLNRPLDPLIEPIQLARIMALDAVLALDHHQADVALGDIRANKVMQAGLSRDPSWFGGVAAISVNAVTTSVVFRGLAHHDWTDAQLAELEQLYARNDFLAVSQWALRSEALKDLGTFGFFKKQWSNGDRGLESYLPGGWWDQNAAHAIGFYLEEAGATDPKAQRYFANVANAVAARAGEAGPLDDSVAPWQIWALEAEPITKGLHTYPQAQVWSDQTRIACALERYRLAHGNYPATLDALVPAYIDAVPHDIMNGEPYRYQVRKDGTFQLYSVGWDQVDDQGDMVWETDHPEVQDYAHGDWVWPTAK